MRLVTTVLTLFTAALVVAGEAPPQWTDFVNQDTFAVVRVDLSEIDLDALSEYGREVFVPGDPALGKFFDNDLPRWLREFRAAGGREVFLVMGTSDLASPPTPSVIIPLSPAADADQLAGLLVTGRPDGAHTDGAGLAAKRMKQAVIVSTPVRLRLWQVFEPAKRPDLTAAMQAVDDCDLQIAIAFPVYTRRLVELSLGDDQLPPPNDNVSVEQFLDALQWCAVGAERPPDFSVVTLVKAADEEAAQLLMGVFDRTFRSYTEGDYAPGYRRLAALIRGFVEPRRDGDTLRNTLDRDQFVELVGRLVYPVLVRARDLARQVVSATRLTAIAKGISRYADAHDGHCPPGLEKLVTKGFVQAEDLKSPFSDDLPVGFVYLDPGIPLGEIDNADTTIIAYDRFDTWPEIGVVCVFADLHVEKIRDPATFERRLAQNPGARSAAPDGPTGVEDGPVKGE